MKNEKIAAVGTDGTRLVVWGLGQTEADAMLDTEDQSDDLAIFGFVTLSAERAALVDDGYVGLDDLGLIHGTDYRYSDGEIYEIGYGCDA